VQAVCPVQQERGIFVRIEHIIKHTSYFYYKIIMQFVEFKTFLHCYSCWCVLYIDSQK